MKDKLNAWIRFELVKTSERRSLIGVHQYKRACNLILCKNIHKSSFTRIKSSMATSHQKFKISIRGFENSLLPKRLGARRLQIIRPNPAQS